MYFNKYKYYCNVTENNSYVQVRDTRRTASEESTSQHNLSAPPDSNHIPAPVPLYIIVDDDELAVEPDKTAFRPKTRKQSRNGRRGSVSAERYDPEADAAGGTDVKVVHPKTEEQQK